MLGQDLILPTELAAPKGMNVSKIDAARSQLTTAIELYFEDRDPVSVHTLAMAAAEIIDRLCEARGLQSMRDHLLAEILPERRKEVGDALNKARNFFKHASSSKPNQVLADFSDDRNMLAISFAVDGFRQLGLDTAETKAFKAWLMLVEPNIFLNPPPRDQLAAIFGDIWSKPRSEQKSYGRDALSIARTGKLP
jgi:hypothetical protein